MISESNIPVVKSNNHNMWYNHDLNQIVISICPSLRTMLFCLRNVIAKQDLCSVMNSLTRFLVFVTYVCVLHHMHAHACPPWSLIFEVPIIQWAMWISNKFVKIERPFLRHAWRILRMSLVCHHHLDLWPLTSKWHCELRVGLYIRRTYTPNFICDFLFFSNNSTDRIRVPIGRPL